MKLNFPILAIGGVAVVAIVLLNRREPQPQPDYAAPQKAVVPARIEQVSQPIDAIGQMPGYGKQPPAQPLMQRPVEAVPDARNSDAPRPVVPVEVINQPLSVSILGPVKGKLSDGPFHFSAVLSGQVTSIKWRARRIDIVPGMDVRGLTIVDNGREATFAGAPGAYVIGAGVASSDGAIDWWWHDFELEKDEPEPSQTTATEPQHSEPPPTDTAHTVPSPQPVQPQEDLASYVSKLVNVVVQSPTRGTDAVSVGGCFRSVANTIQTGQYAGNEPLSDVYKQVQLALGPAAVHWEPFFNGIGALLANLRQRGIATSPENVAVILGEIGNVLASAH